MKTPILVSDIGQSKREQGITIYSSDMSSDTKKKPVQCAAWEPAGDRNRHRTYRMFNLRLEGKEGKEKDEE